LFRWLRKEFYELRGKTDTVTFGDIKKWLTKSYYRISSNKLRDHFKVGLI